MSNSNLQVGKCYREESSYGGFRYIKLESINEVGGLVGECVTAFNEYQSKGGYVDQGRWEKITKKEFMQMKKLSIK
jgi:hypothetical protein